MLKAGPPHWMVVKRIMRYLKSTLDFKLCFGSNDIALKGFCDADWAGVANDWQFTTGYVFLLLGLESFCGKCKKQPTLALSMMKAEYMATRLVH
jgi:hypothetical protein